MNDWTTCNVCGVRVKQNNYTKHLRKHRKGWIRAKHQSKKRKNHKGRKRCDFIYYLPETGLADKKYGNDWTCELRRQIRSRDNYICQLCSYLQDGDGLLAVHHISGDKSDSCPENLISLCGRCHYAVHRSREDARRYRDIFQQGKDSIAFHQAKAAQQLRMSHRDDYDERILEEGYSVRYGNPCEFLVQEYLATCAELQL